MHNCFYFKRDKKFILFKNDELKINNLMNNETRDILIWSLCKRDILKDNEYLINILSIY